MKKTYLKKARLILIISVLVFSVTAMAQPIQPYHSIKVGLSEQIYDQNPLDIIGKETIFFEGFEEGIMPPTGWSKISYNANGNDWWLTDGSVYPEYVHSGNYAAWVQYDSIEDSDEWLISPEIELPADLPTTLNFWAQSDTNYPGATVKLYIRGDGIEDVVWDMIADEQWPEFEYREVSIDLSDYIGETINISWQYIGLDGDSFGLDDISIILPEPVLTIENIAGGFGISAVINNTGNAEATNVTYTITLDGGLIILGKETTNSIPTLAAGASEAIKAGFILGIGKTTITISVSCDEGATASATATATVLLFFVLNVA